ncbi:hypothetical protein DU833_21440 [Salmonella enterica subsp. enterica serovar Chester]|uniref:Uncharacterized protein n=1 Tax=Salmonella enterica subsp. enterica serovar Chester TaxID=149386 RepID=A0A5W7EQC3_SALET|nr:hypothetical protein [Salmonella enterica subsp. enterica serovar Chester]EBR0309963.1 hypothetical protein [Salmonella enterica subsp. enterica serovar Chester]EBX7357581.1 hypothetical protein [Salmonella enterica subsp. enterica serovar Chester]EBY2313217.1 hypothetical protein [Salmonella enterica subsp. enterica serovar Chester]ECA9651098.1 hypothetical protein [Salmonella enterica subsp. enterica serovar Chester]
MRNYPLPKIFNLNFFFNVLIIIFYIHSAYHAESPIIALAAISKGVAIVTTIVNKLGFRGKRNSKYRGLGSGGTQKMVKRSN